MDFSFEPDSEEFTAFLTPTYIKEAISDVCTCGYKKRLTEYNGIQRYICDGCGRFDDTRESFDAKINISPETEDEITTYGNKSGEGYIKKIKEDIMAEIQKVAKKYTISHEQMMSIMDKYMTIRTEKIPRAKPRIGLICACIYEETKIPQDQIIQIYGIPQKYLTEGIKLYMHELLPFNNISTESLLENMFISMKTCCLVPEAEKVVVSVRPLICEMCKLCSIYYVAHNTTFKTKFAGVIWYLMESGKITLRPEELYRLLDISRNTILKFYDQFLIILHATGRIDGQFSKNFANRRLQLRAYLENRGIKIMPIKLVGKYKKFTNIYKFSL